MNLEELSAKQEISECILTYCRAIDRCDRSLLASVFHDDSMHDHGPYHGPSRQFCDFALALLAKLEYTTHQASNILIHLVNDQNALSETYFNAYHRVGAGVADAAFPDHDLDQDEDLWISGRYVDHFQRRDGVWKIAKRCGIHDWVRWAPANDRGFSTSPKDGRGQRFPDDVTYHLAIGNRRYALLNQDSKTI